MSVSKFRFRSARPCTFGNRWLCIGPAENGLPGPYKAVFGIEAAQEEFYCRLPFRPPRRSPAGSEFHEYFYSRPAAADTGMPGPENENIFLPRPFSEAPMCQTSAPSVSADCNLLKDSAPGAHKESLPRSSPPRVSGPVLQIANHAGTHRVRRFRSRMQC